MKQLLGIGWRARWRLLRDSWWHWWRRRIACRSCPIHFLEGLGRFPEHLVKIGIAVTQIGEVVPIGWTEIRAC